MNHRRIAPWGRIVLAAATLASGVASAHSASDAYLTLEVDARPGVGRSTVLHGQWDLALRDLDFVLKLDDDGDGTITWAELRKHQRSIAEYAYAYLHVTSGSTACAVRPIRQAVDNHADGAYAVLFFDVVCEGPAKRIAIDYRMFFAIDPSHRGIFVLRSGDSTATSLLAPDNARIELKL
jgi:hypothetical protein